MDESDKQAKLVRLEAIFAPDAHDKIQTYLRSFVSFEPTLGLLYGAETAPGAGDGSWSIAALDQATVNEMIEMYANFGAVICYDISGIRVVIPQIAHIDKLETGRLDFVDNRLHRVPDSTT